MNNWIAIVGIACRFPQASNTYEYWQNIEKGIDCITREDHYDDGNFNSQENKHIYAEGLLDKIEYFDHRFFNYSIHEAMLMDPQQRLFLEVSWEALEFAGYSVDKYTGRIGVYAGMADSSYLFNNIMQNNKVFAKLGSTERSIATSNAFLAMKVSYKLNLHGPSLNINTTCSTGLSTVITAIDELLNYKCDMALVGAATINVSNQLGYEYQDDNIYSKDGYCRPFDANASGTVPASGVAALVLKRYEDAIADHDHIEAVIIGSGINNDGLIKASFTAPSSIYQTECILDALATAEISADTIEYVEAHGTGTIMGDPIEVKALTDAYRTQTSKRQYCAIGSVKENIGHTDTVAGLAGLIKATYALRTKLLPPSIHFEQVNPQLNLAQSPFYINTTLKNWESAKGHPRRAAVSSFGIGGTNTHVIIQEAAQQIAMPTFRPFHVLTLSAQSHNSLIQKIHDLKNYLSLHYNQKNASVEKLADIAFTLGVGRKEFEYRTALVCENYSEAFNQLGVFSVSEIRRLPPHESRHQVAFVFLGQGEKQLQAAYFIYQREPIFRTHFDDCAARLYSLFDIDIRYILSLTSEQEASTSQLLEHPEFLQPLLFTIQYALAKLLLHWNIIPSVYIGHSLGEYAAAHFAGVFSLEDSLYLVAQRARLMSSLENGAMLAVGLAEDQISKYIQHPLALAAVNQADLCVVSGPNEAIENFRNLMIELHQSNIFLKNLDVSYAFHSSMIEPILNDYRNELASIKMNLPSVPIISTLTGHFINEDIATVDYWINQCRQTVRFHDAITSLAKHHPQQILFQLGLGKSMGEYTTSEINNSFVMCRPLATQKSSRDKPQEMYRQLYYDIAKAWLYGVSINWGHFYDNEKRQRVPLPTYPFARQKFWIEPDQDKAQGLAEEPTNAIGYYEVSWYRNILKNITQELNFPAHLRWLIFYYPCTLMDNIISILNNNKQDYYLIEPGDQFQQNERSIKINIHDNIHYNMLIDAVINLESKSNNIYFIHAWGVEQFANNASITHASLQHIELLTFYSILWFIQALTAVTETIKLNGTIITTEVNSVTGDEHICPAKATLLGLNLVVPQEHSNIKLQCVDVTQTEENSINTQIIATDILLQLLNINDQYNCGSYRNNVRWEKEFRAQKNHAIKAKIDLNNGTFLITGGLGGIGLHVADVLLAQGAQTVILTSRQVTGFSSDIAELKTLKHAKTFASSWRKKNKNVVFSYLDLSDETTIITLKENIINAYGSIDGIVHAAGVSGHNLARLKKINDVESQFDAKVYGTYYLAKHFSNSALKFFISCSSLTAEIGGVGQCDYAGANACIAAFSYSQFFRPDTFVSAIGWNGWVDTGLFKNSTDIIQNLVMNNTILPDEGRQIFIEVLKKQLTNPIISNVDLNEFIFKYKDNIKSLLTIENSTEKPVNISNNQTVLVKIKKIYEEILESKDISIDDDFFELGGHSLLALMLISKLASTFNEKIPLNLIYELRTIRTISFYLESKDLREKPFSPVVCLKHGNSDSPLFLIHPVGGSCFLYIPFVQYLTTDRPIYAIQDPGISGETMNFASVHEIAQCYIQQMKKIQPTGPYYLAGASFGGTVCFEIAQILLSKNEQVSFLGMFDSWARFNNAFYQEDYFIKRMQIQQQRLRSALSHYIDLPASPWLDLQWNRMQLLLNYRPQMLKDTQIILFKANELLEEYKEIDEQVNYWQNYSAKRIKCENVPGNHETMFLNENAKILAQKISCYI